MLHTTGSPVSTHRNPHMFLYFGQDPYLPQHATFLQSKPRYLSSDEDKTCLDELRQTYMLAALNTREACSKQNKETYNDILRLIWNC